jgi:caffeoyl-CoA O-methyltransferase
MAFTRTAWWLLALSLWAVWPALSEREELKAADDALMAALNRRDIEGVLGRLHKDYVSLGASAETPTAWTSLSPPERRERVRAIFAPFEQFQIGGEEGTVYQVAGTTGIVSGVERLNLRRPNRAPELVRQRFTRTWQVAEGKWLLLSSHRSDFAGEALTRFPIPESEAERRIIEVAEQAPRYANVTLSDARVLRILAEFGIAKTVVEFGTSTGYSGLWLANGLRKTGGKLITFELDAGRAAIARENFKKAGVDGIVELIEGDAEKEGYREYLEQVLPLVRPGGLIVAHNMRFPTPSKDFVEAVTTNSALDTVFIHMHDRGMSLSLKKR